MSDALVRPIADRELEVYAAAHSTPSSPLLRRVADATRAWSDYPDYMIDEVEGMLLTLLVAISGARRILEVGTFTGYSALCMAEAMPPDGHIVTLELRADHAAKATEHVELAGMHDRITVIQGPALDSLARLEGPFDLAFIDADKPGYPAYYEAVLGLMRPGGLIVADNVLRGGRVLDGSATEPGTAGMRTFNDRVVADPRVDCVMLTIRDGVSLIRVRE
ncbi:MAG TPA: O-methyltransferase [Candidatus Limnocylindrales bacterium]|nr:O-methyltransferase [Candidatus Limnocylindrales bacterium]